VNVADVELLTRNDSSMNVDSSVQRGGQVGEAVADCWLVYYSGIASQVSRTV